VARPAANSLERRVKAAGREEADGAAKTPAVGDRVTISPATSTYETPEKLEAALDRLLDEIG
jgi:hypothetical protein